MMFVLSALAFLVLLTLLVLIHEFGHFAVARWAGVHVEEFGFGLPPRARKLFAWQGTLFSLNWIPFGGFVRLRGETSTEREERERPGGFAAASIPARLSILVAGVFMNFFLALVLLTLGFSLWRWVPTYLTIDALQAGAARNEVSVTWGLFISDVLPDGSAKGAGVAAGAVLTAVDGTPVATAEDVLWAQAGKQSVQYTLRTGSAFTEEKTLRVGVHDGKTGVALSPFALQITGNSHSLGMAVALALRETRTITVQTVRGAGVLLSSLLSTGRVPKGITGIVGIAQLTHDSVQEGFLTYLRLVALLSLSLAALNVLPFPALDGGRMLFVFAEMVLRRPVNRRLEVITNTVGFFIILVLIAAVTLNDIIRVFSSSSL